MAHLVEVLTRSDQLWFLRPSPFYSQSFMIGAYFLFHSGEADWPSTWEQYRRMVQSIATLPISSPRAATPSFTIVDLWYLRTIVLPLKKPFSTAKRIVSKATPGDLPKKVMRPALPWIRQLRANIRRRSPLKYSLFLFLGNRNEGSQRPVPPSQRRTLGLRLRGRPDSAWLQRSWLPLATTTRKARNHHLQ